MNRPAPLESRRAVAATAALAAVLASGAALGQYKVTGPDGRVTYTDRPPATVDSRITPLNARGGSAGSESDLPFELRQIATRFPVTLYTSAGTCEPCESARALLRQRGIPYIERQAISAEDGDALERLTGGRDAPTLTIGSQTLRGLSPDVWTSYLDAAGYPRQSRLPPTYTPRPPLRIVERRDAVPARAATAPAARPEAGGIPAPPPPGPGGIKF
ncbi:glutaredoxin family protein [Piscinibacter koreensis]|uniref:Glutaredoxin family protein n=1 Tax=Piscinibacter koreensis TaxID=2742824 RepID=A0A7Y6NKY3_9BURK|nr:glutaredoxin family protein [Schlegelella koreensis]NUZ05067.1 glutaredoxin family protein [Schlegelella koreensis]